MIVKLPPHYLIGVHEDLDLPLLDHFQSIIPRTRVFAMSGGIGTLLASRQAHLVRDQFYELAYFTTPLDIDPTTITHDWLESHV